MVHAIKEMRDFIELDVQAGYDNREQIINNAIDYLLGDYALEWLEEQATTLTDNSLKYHYDLQQTWSHVTDCDRLDEAFAELDRHGIVARQHFTCCQTCGHSEINIDIDATRQHRPVIGYVFFHQQDTESAVRSGYLYLAYGSVDGKSSASEYIAQLVVETLRRHGLDADWAGTVQTRICIQNLIWERRRVLEFG